MVYAPFGANNFKTLGYKHIFKVIPLVLNHIQILQSMLTNTYTIFFNNIYTSNTYFMTKLKIWKNTCFKFNKNNTKSIQNDKINIKFDAKPNSYRNQNVVTIQCQELGSTSKND